MNDRAVSHTVYKLFMAMIVMMVIIIHVLKRTANTFRKMVELPGATWSKDEDKDKKEEDDESHLHSSSRNIQDHNSKQSTLSDFTT